MMAPRVIARVPKNKQQDGGITTTTLPTSPPSATLIPQSPDSPGYTNNTPVVVAPQGPALYGTVDQINTPEYAQRQGQAEGAAAAKKQLEEQKKILALLGLGGGSSKTKALTANAKAIEAALKNGSYGKAYDELISKLSGMTSNAANQINTGYDSLATMLQGQKNPYANMQFTATQADPQLAQFLQSQGGSMDALNARVSAENAANTASAQQFNNIAALLNASTSAGQTQRVADVGAARLAALQDLQAQGGAYGFNVEQQKMAERNRLNKILLDLAAKGINVKGMYGG